MTTEGAELRRGDENQHPPEGYLELYKLAVEMADRVSARRATANTFFLTANTALFVFINANPSRLLWLASAAGTLLSLAWWLLLKSYRDLNKAKFDVILGMEKVLPARVFGDEWKMLKEDRPRGWRGRYAEFSTVERFVPFIFIVLYLAALIWESVH